MARFTSFSDLWGRLSWKYAMFLNFLSVSSYPYFCEIFLSTIKKESIVLSRSSKASMWRISWSLFSCQGRFEFSGLGVRTFSWTVMLQAQVQCGTEVDSCHPAICTWRLKMREWTNQPRKNLFYALITMGKAGTLHCTCELYVDKECSIILKTMIIKAKVKQ